MQSASAKVPQGALLELLWDGDRLCIGAFSHVAASPEDFEVDAVRLDPSGDIVVDIKRRTAQEAEHGQP